MAARGQIPGTTGAVRRAKARLLLAACLLAGAGAADSLPCAGPPGAPSLPGEVALFRIPDGASCTGLAWSVRGWLPCAGAGTPEPVQRPRRGDAAAAWCAPDPAYYARDVWPAAPAELDGTFTVEGRRMLRVRVSPRRWRGAAWAASGTGVVEVAEGLSFTPLFTRAAKAALAGTVPDGGGGPDLLVLAPPDLRAAWEHYAARRRAQLPDWTVRVVGTDEVYRDHPFGEGLPCRNAAESIHAFLRASARPGATHVLLGGAWFDAAEGAPARHFPTGERLSLSNCVPGVCARPCMDDLCGPVPSDMFYACLDANAAGGAHPWDPDGDGLYLSESEAADCDTAADIPVGRFAPVPWDAGDGTLPTPCQTVTNYAEKVARGLAASFPGRHRFALASGLNWTSAPRAGTLLGRPHPEQAFLDDVPNVWDAGHPDTVSDGEWTTRETLRTLVAPYWPVAEVESLHAHGPLAARRHASWQAAKDAYFAQDRVWTTCRSHGSPASVAGGVVTRDLAARATGLALFDEFALPCLTGRPDLSLTRDGRAYAVPSLGIAATASPRGGALAGLYNAGNGWANGFGGMSLSDGYSATLGHLATQNAFREGDATLGLAVLHARQQYAATYAPKGVRLFLLCEQFFYGDPSLGLPESGRDVALAAETELAEPRTAVTAQVAGASAAVAGPGPFRVMDALTCAGTNLVLATAGGVAGRIAFADAPGRLELGGSAAFHAGGLANCAEVVLAGGGKTVDATGAGTALRRIASTGGTNVLRCTTSGGLAQAEPLRVADGWLRCETAEAFGAGGTALAEVSGGGILWAESPLAGWDGDGEHLARPVWLRDAAFVAAGRRRVRWGRHAKGVWDAFALHASGTSTVAAAGEAASVGLVGTTTVDLSADAVLALAATLEDEEEGRLVFTGTGRAVAEHAACLAGSVEVRSGAVLELAELPLAVTALVVRAGAVLRLPASASGRHDVVAGGGGLVVEAGAAVEDRSGRRLEGLVMDGAFLEPAATLRWKGGAGLWSDPAGWFDAATGAWGPWRDGRTAVFDAAGGSHVSNDLADVSAPGLVFAADAELAGGRIRLETGTLRVPDGVVAAVRSELVHAGEVAKHGAGRLVLAGAQGGLSAGGLALQEGALELDGVAAPGPTNLAAAAGTSLEVRGRNVLAGAAACATLATNALACAAPGAVLELEDFRPLRGTEVPEGLALVVAPRDLKGCAAWNAAVRGRVDYRGVLSLLYGRIDGPGTVRVAGLRSQSTYGATFGACRLELAPEGGVFPVYEDISWGRGVFVFDGTTVAPTGSLVVSSAAYPASRTTLYVDDGGVVLDVPAGADLVFGDAEPTYLFGGSGGLVKRGAGRVRFTTVADQHDGPTVVEEGTYALATWTTTRELRVAAGAVADFADPYPSGLSLTNLVLEAGSRVELGVSSEGADLLDARGGSVSLPTDGAARLGVTVAPGTPPGVYDVLAVDELPAGAALETHVALPSARPAAWLRTPRGLSVRVLPAPTVLHLR